eukprot:4364665-Pyramimonas_sp.AAC.1
MVFSHLRRFPAAGGCPGAVKCVWATAFLFAFVFSACTLTRSSSSVEPGYRECKSPVVFVPSNCDVSSYYYGLGSRRRALQHGIRNRSTHAAMLEYVAANTAMFRTLSEAEEILAFYILCGQCPHPGPFIRVWCPLCPNRDVDGFHKSSKKPYPILPVPIEQHHPEYVFNGQCFWVLDSKGA